MVAIIHRLDSLPIFQKDKLRLLIALYAFTDQTFLETVSDSFVMLVYVLEKARQPQQINHDP